MPAPAPPPVPGPCPPPTTAAATLRRPAMRSGCGASTRGRSSLICWSAGSAVTLTRGAGGTSTAAGAARAGIGKKLMTGRSPPPAPPPPPPLRSRLFGRSESDDLHPGGVREVHRVHHFPVLPVRRRLDEHELRRAVLVQLLQRRPELVLRVGLLVDRIAAVGQELEHDLSARL